MEGFLGHLAGADDGGVALASLASLWMGVLGTISPCPMSANVAAVSVIASGGGRGGAGAVKSAAAFGLGRMFVCAAAGVAILKGVSTAGGLSALSMIPAKFAGPLFILLGAVLLDWVELPSIGGVSIKRKVMGDGRGGVGRTFAIGCVFAALPCPETAALFFGGMIPAAIGCGSTVLVPLMFGLGSALPLMLLGALLSLGVGKFAARLGALRRAESVLRGATCAVLIAFGFYLTLTRVWGVGG